MSFIIKHTGSGEIFSCMLINMYNFEYYGVKFWEDEQTARAEYASVLLLAGFDELSDWDVVEIEEERLKLFNVKLNNNPRRRLFLNEQGIASVRTVES